MTTMQPYEIHAYIGDGWTEEQRDQITQEYLAMEPHTPADERGALLDLIAQRVDGVLDPERVAQEDVGAQVAAEESRKTLRAAVRASIAGGMSEYEATRVFGVTRMTIRKWTGKG